MSTHLEDFLRETQADVRGQTAEGSLFAELAFAELVMQHMADIGITFEPVVCHYKGKVGNSNLRLTGYALSEDADQLDLFVSLYSGVEEVVSIAESEVTTAAAQCMKFLELCAQGKMAAKVDPSTDIHSLALTIREKYNDLGQIRVFVLTDRVLSVKSRAKMFESQEVARKSIHLEVMDIERLYHHWAEGKPRDEVLIDFRLLTGGPLPCVFVPGETEDYDYALAAIPGETLSSVYDKFGARLLEANVRSFLSVKSKGVNAGIQSTLRASPERFMAYNNGVVLVVDGLGLETAHGGFPGIAWLRGVQIVNGGQTTASMFFVKRRFPTTDLSRVRVPAKIIVLKVQDPAKEEALVSDISRFANSQNAVRQSDLSANKPFHIELERLSDRVYCPDGVGRWFYERATGSYNTRLAREGSTLKARALKETIPSSRRITKTDLARYLTAWDGKPDVVSLGSQKCFDRFMAGMSNPEGEQAPPSPTAADFKVMIAKAIVFKAVQKRVRHMLPAFQANVVAYTVAVISTVLGPQFDFNLVWKRQSVSEQFLAQVSSWAREVNDALYRTSGGRMISEWAKKPECRVAVLGSNYPKSVSGIPEVRGDS